MSIFGAREMSNVPAPTWWFTTACNSISLGSDFLSGLHRQGHGGGTYTCIHHTTYTHKRPNLCYLSVNNRETTCSGASSTLLNKRQPRRLSLTVSCSFGEIHRGSSSGRGIPVVCTVNWRGRLVSRCGCRPVINVVFEESLVVA